MSAAQEQATNSLGGAEFWIAVVIGLGLLAALGFLVRGMIGGREMPVDLRIRLMGAGTDPMEVARLLEALRGVEVRRQSPSHWQLVRRVTPGWVVLFFFVIGIFAVLLMAVIKQDRITEAFVVDAPDGRWLHVSGRLTKLQVEALRGAADRAPYPA